LLSISFMTLRLDQAPNPESLLSRLDPRWKLAGLTLAALTVVFLRTLPAAALAFACVLALACLARLPWGWFATRLMSVALVLILFVAPLPFLAHDENQRWHLGPMAISIPGVRLAFNVYLLLCCKSLSIVGLMLIVLATAPLSVTLKAAQALRVPNLLVHLVMLTYRYLFVLARELSRLRVALRVRGYRNRASSHSYRTIGHVAGTLLVRGYERAERVGQAMRCRGFDGRFRALSEFGTAPADVIFFVTLAGSAGMLLVWDLIQR
jgi:cobalt/nickel transport system permease protein